MRHKLISILGAKSHERTENLNSFAKELGTKLAKSHFGIICDGSDNISSVVSESLCCADKNASIVALINGSDISCDNKHCSIVIPTGNAWGSDRLVANGGDVAVIIGGGVEAVSLLDFLYESSEKQIFVVTGFSDLLDDYSRAHINDERITRVKSVDEIMWSLDVLNEEFSFLPKGNLVKEEKISQLDFNFQ